MTGTSTFRLAGTGTRPSMTGTYSLASASTIEFSNIAGTQQDIRTTPTYGNIVISGTNVGLSNATASLTLQSGSTFTVKNGATFNARNTNGFSGGSSTAISNTNSPNFNLETNSTITYNGIASQVISSRSDYKKLTFTGGHTRNLTSSITVAEEINLSTSTDILSIGSNILTLNGTVTGSGTLSGSATSDLTIGGSAGTIAFTSGSRTLRNLVIGTGSSASLTLGSDLDIAPLGGITFNATGTKSLTTTGRVLTLKSTTAGTAYIANLNGATITGNVTAERFIASSARRWRFIGSPFSNATFADLQNEVYITGVGTGNTVGTFNSNGFDATTSNQPSVFSYNEPATGNLNSGWVGLTNSTSSLTNQPITVGKGYRIFIRGDRSDLGRLSGTLSSQNEVTLNLTGTINSGDINLPVSFTANNGVSDDGWNLVNNPYPCAFDWNAYYDAGVNYTNIDPTVWILDATANSYKSYNASSDAGTLTNGIIPAGASFWIKANATSPTVTVKEQFKTASAPIALFKNNANNELKLTLTLDSITKDEWILAYRNGSTAQVETMDIVKMQGGVNVSSLVGNTLLACDVRPLQNDTIQLAVSGGNQTYVLAVNTLPINQKHYYLYDAKLGSTSLLTAGFNYTYTTSATDSSSFGPRFSIITSDNSSLPVTYAYFKAAAQQQSAVLSWATATEINSNYFELEHSTNMKDWNTIANIKGKGNSTQIVNYEFTHQNIELHTIHYYRIKQVDYNTHFSYSPVRSVSIGKAHSTFTIWPNPASDVVSIKNPQGNYQLAIIDMNGKSVANAYGTHINITALQAGVYTLIVTTSAGEVSQHKLVKQ
jgi:hypothetical protein